MYIDRIVTSGRSVPATLIHNRFKTKQNVSNSRLVSSCVKVCEACTQIYNVLPHARSC